VCRFDADAQADSPAVPERIPTDRHHLVTDNHRLVPWVMTKYFREHQYNHILWDAIRDKAEWGLLVAAARYKDVTVTPERGTLVKKTKPIEFSTYAVSMIWGYCFHAIRRHYRHDAELATVSANMNYVLDRDREPFRGPRDQDRQQAVKEWLSCLCGVDRKIVEMRYGIGGAEPMSLDQIGAQIGCSGERVRQKFSRAAKRLREHAARAGFALSS
jgi:RNA polymerase sigma factor (sigma-70 family)